MENGKDGEYEKVRRSCCDRASWMIYLTHVMSSWGDRMWSFAVGLYMFDLNPTTLQLTAIYGFSSSLSILILGAWIGSWIDKSQRLYVTRVTLLIQNGTVILGAIFLATYLWLWDGINSSLDSGLQRFLLFIFVMLAVIADLASMGNKIALEKDWIVVLSGGEQSKLAALNSTMRSIDLSTSILAPIVVGQLMTYASKITAACFIGVWNLISGIVEYYLLTQIYKAVPNLKKTSLVLMNIPDIQLCSPESASSLRSCVPNIIASSQTPPNPNKNSNNIVETLDASDLNKQSALLLTPRTAFENTLTEISLVTPDSEKYLIRENSPYTPTPVAATTYSKPSKSNKKQKNNMSNYFSGWAMYFTHPVRNAGIGLALLYMTVCGFDNITTGFARSQGLTESVISILTAAGAIFGILGSLSFPFLRKKLGKSKTGVIGFGLESMCLLLCIASVFVPTSPFQPEALYTTFPVSTNLPDDDVSLAKLFTEQGHLFLLLGGIILARYGLWIADLSVTQIFQENVPEDKRGVLNGVQDSLNQFMNLIKFFLVMVLPSPNTFGYLVILSWIFVFMGWMFFISYAVRQQSKHNSTSRAASQQHHIPLN